MTHMPGGASHDRRENVARVADDASPPAASEQPSSARVVAVDGRPLVTRLSARERAAQLRLAGPETATAAAAAGPDAPPRGAEERAQTGPTDVGRTPRTQTPSLRPDPEAAASRLRDLCAKYDDALAELERRSATVLESAAVSARRAQDAARRAEARLEAFDSAVRPVLATAIREIREAAAGTRTVTQPPGEEERGDREGESLAEAQPQRGTAGRVVGAVAVVAAAVAIVIYGGSLHRRTASAEAAAAAAERAAEDARRTVERELAAQAARTEGAVADALALGHHAARMVEVMAAPDARRMDLLGRAAAPAAIGQAFWSRTRGVVISATGIPPAAAGQGYQVWIVTSAGPLSLGFASADAQGRLGVTFELPQDLAGSVRGFLLTREPAGGSPSPRGALLLSN